MVKIPEDAADFSPYYRASHSRLGRLDIMGDDLFRSHMDPFRPIMLGDILNLGMLPKIL